MTINVLLRLVLWKQARYEVSSFTVRSCSVVATIIVTFLSMSKLVFCGEVRRRKTFLASSKRPFRTSHHGDSGAKNSSGMSMIGQTHLDLYVRDGDHDRAKGYTHCTAKGIR